ncbi:MAG: IS1182 family transposase [Candidatus Hydrogenedentes bacterium]|nr:IS1182 family transposase [Candidatus Hydrogenedentota bacterium]
MRREIRADYEQSYLLPPSLEDWLSEDHPTRFIRDFVDSLDLQAHGFVVRDRSGEAGRSNYAADLLLKVWLYGYLSRVHSVRALERACREHISLLWLTGTHAPDHNTLWRFLRGNRTALKRLFETTVRTALRLNLVGMVLHAVDGTKMKAWCSRRGVLDQEQVEALLTELDAAAEEFMRLAQEEAPDDDGQYALPEELQDVQSRREQIRAVLEAMEQDKANSVQPREPEARWMKTDEGLRLGYNAQAVVDGQSGIIVAEDVVNAPTDHAQLTPMIEQVAKTTGGYAADTIADSGYRSAQSIAYAEERGYAVLVNGNPHTNPSATQAPYHMRCFAYEKERDVYRCPEGQMLTYIGTRANRHGHYAVRRYRCASCQTCSKKTLCTSSPKGRTVERSPYVEAVARHDSRLETTEGQRTLSRRKTIVEPVFALIKHTMGFRRFTAHGLEAVRAQWTLICIAANLKRLMTSIRRQHHTPYFPILKITT